MFTLYHLKIYIIVYFVLFRDMFIHVKKEFTTSKKTS